MSESNITGNYVPKLRKICTRCFETVTISLQLNKWAIFVVTDSINLVSRDAQIVNSNIESRNHSSVAGKNDLVLVRDFFTPTEIGERFNSTNVIHIQCDQMLGYKLAQMHP